MLILVRASALNGSFLATLGGSSEIIAYLFSALAYAESCMPWVLKWIGYEVVHVRIGLQSLVQKVIAQFSGAVCTLSARKVSDSCRGWFLIPIARLQLDNDRNG